MTALRSRGGTRRTAIAGYRVTDDHGEALRQHTRAVLDSEPNIVPDVAIGLARLCRAAAVELVLDHVSVTVMTATGSSAVVASSTPAELGLDELQFDLGEGPAQDAYVAGRPVLVPDLRTSEGRWPGFASASIQRDVLGIFCFPLQLGAVRLGVLTCARRVAGPLAPVELTASLIFAEVATELLLDSSPTGANPDPDLRSALRWRTEVYQAQGIVMVDLDVTLEVALARMRAAAFAEGISLQQLAADIVAGRRVLRTGDDP
jgi:ANTAR domain-containing protein/GAF domain-containing protein